MFDGADLIRMLRAAGEPTRLRLLALCADQPRSVGALAELLRQSEPRVSRHLKQLCEAGLLERLPAGGWVRYRVTRGGTEAELVRELLARWSAHDALRRRDAERARELDLRDAEALARAGRGARLARSLRGFLESTIGAGAPGPVLVVGDAPQELVAAVAHQGAEAVALVPTRRAAQRLRAWAAAEDLACEARVGELATAAALARTLAHLPPPAAIVVDRPRAAGAQLAALLRELRRHLAPGGRLWLFERYEALEPSRERIVEHPLARLRRVLAGADFDCTRLQPIEADGEHVIAVAARARAPQEQVA